MTISYVWEVPRENPSMPTLHGAQPDFDWCVLGLWNLSIRHHPNRIAPRSWQDQERIIPLPTAIERTKQNVGYEVELATASEGRHARPSDEKAIRILF